MNCIKMNSIRSNNIKMNNIKSNKLTWKGQHDNKQLEFAREDLPIKSNN